MEYSYNKSLYLVMRRFEKISRRSSFSSSTSSQIMAVNFKFTFASSFHDWILRPQGVNFLGAEIYGKNLLRSLKMAYPVNTCDKSLIMIMHDTEKTPRPDPLPSFHHFITVHIKLVFKSVRYNWVTRPPCLVPEFIHRVDSDLIQNSLSFNHRQFMNLERLRGTIAAQMAAWPLTPEERHQLAVIMVAESSIVVGSLLPLHTEHVHINFLLVENHRHTSDQDPPPATATVLPGSVSQNFACPRSAVVTIHDINQY